MNTTMSDSTAAPSVASGIAGRTDYAQWDKLASELVNEVEQEEQNEIAQQKAALGLDGKYARSQAEADEREKAKDVQKVKKTLEKYQAREKAVMATLVGLLGPVSDTDTTNDETSAAESKATDAQTVRITRDRIDAGQRVITLCDTSGNSRADKIIFTQDLSLLESQMPVNAAKKSYTGDAENDVVEDVRQPPTRSIFGIIKAFVNNVHNCTIVVKCKVISGTIEMHNCSNVTIRVEAEATVATVQVDLSDDITLEFRDAPSGKNTGALGSNKLYWGDDRDDRVYHAGVKNFQIRIVRDDFVETEIFCDYEKDGATTIGNATSKEMQFVSSCIDGKLHTEKVVRAGSTTGKNARAMTQRELDEEDIRRQKAAGMAIAMAEDMIKITDKDGKLVTKVDVPTPIVTSVEEGEDVEEIYTSMSKDEIKSTVDECEQNKARGNEAFGAGEYGQAILLYSLALDKADELPDKNTTKALFPRDVVLSNRAACFLKLGQHEKAEQDASKALKLNPNNVKASFRRGLALHAMGQYFEALPILANAHKLEPHNKQIKQALQFCDVRIQQEQRKRMEG
jgi:hypothetical protein